jgi:hypothetical protein
MARDRGCHRGSISIGMDGKLRPTGRQRAGLVENHDVDGGKALQRAAIADHDAAAMTPR